MAKQLGYLIATIKTSLSILKKRLILKYKITMNTYGEPVTPKILKDLVEEVNFYQGGGRVSASLL
ncbi:hypothetical protein [Campylobacter concisus]